MAKDSRSTYEVTINGMKHVLLLDAEDAENYGRAAKKISPPVSVVEAPADEDEAPADDPENETLIDPETAAKTSRRR